MTTALANYATVTVRDIMNYDKATVTADLTIAELARKLIDLRLTGLPVIDAKGALTGMVSEYDVISRSGATVNDIMSRGLISVTEETNVEQVASLMGLHGIRRVPVVRDGQLVGTVSRADLLRLFLSGG
jgi:CBS domain-containing protein